MRRKPVFITLLILGSFLASPFTNALANGKDRLTVDLYMDWESVAAPQISPDGNQIVYTRRWTDKINDKYESDVWIINADGSKHRFLLKGGAPQWSPDGKRLAYIAQGLPQGAQLFVKWMDTGEETQLTRVERGISGFQWSPDGKRIAFTMNVPALCDPSVV